MQHLFGAFAGNQKAMDGFAQVNAGTISPAAFFSPEERQRDYDHYVIEAATLAYTQQIGCYQTWTDH